MSSLFRRMLAGLCAALIIGVPAFGDAGAATSPIRLADTVTIENAQVTANQVSPFTDSIRDLNRALNINIFVVIIDSPTGDMYNWTRTTATQNGLQSGKDVLLAIALESRDATIDSLGYLSGTQQNDILTRGLKPGLSSRPVDWERAGYDFYTVFEQVWMNNVSPQNYSSSARQESGDGSREYLFCLSSSSALVESLSFSSLSAGSAAKRRLKRSHQGDSTAKETTPPRLINNSWRLSTSRATMP